MWRVAILVVIDHPLNVIMAGASLLVSLLWAAAVAKIVALDLTPRAMDELQAAAAAAASSSSNSGSDSGDVAYAYCGYAALGTFQLWLTLFTGAGATEIATAGTAARYYFEGDAGRKGGGGRWLGGGGPGFLLGALRRSLTAIGLALTKSLGAAVMGGVVCVGLHFLVKLAHRGLDALRGRLRSQRFELRLAANAAWAAALRGPLHDTLRRTGAIVGAIAAAASG